MSTPPPGTVRLIHTGRDGVERTLTLIVVDAPERAGGVGGWQSAERPLREPGKWWQGQPADTLRLECMLDLYAIPGPSVERRLNVLYSFGQKGNGTTPPVLRLAGDIPARDKDLRWVIQQVTLGERLFTSTGELRRQHLSLELESYSPLPSIKPVAIKRTRDRGGRRARRVTTKKGDTLRSLAVRHLGYSGGWKKIVQWNRKLFKGVDPDQRLRAGLKVTLR